MSAALLLNSLRAIRDNRLHVPSHARVVLRDLLRLRPPRISRARRDLHLQAAIDRLCLAQDVHDDDGCAARFSFRKGWEASTPKDTAYASQTFYDLFALTGDRTLLDRARRMSTWELAVQMDIGAFAGSSQAELSKPVVFNTGQVIMSLIRAREETAEDRYLDAARRAADWLVAIQDDDGAWRRHTFMERVHLYNTQVAWALLLLDGHAATESYRQAAVDNIEWALLQQQDNGWFESNSFEGEASSSMHIIAFATRAILEAGLILNEQRYIAAARNVADNLMRRFLARGTVAGDFDGNWLGSTKYTCLSGAAQLSLIWFRLSEIDPDADYVEAGCRMNDYLCRLQNLNTMNAGIRGGLMGSDPIWGDFQSYRYPTVTLKYFVDALIVEKARLSAE